MSEKSIVLDANILIRAVLGRRVRDLIVDNSLSVGFFAPDVAYADARKYLPPLLNKRGIPSFEPMRLLHDLETLVQVVDVDSYVGSKELALQRIAIRDADDWPVLACALVLDCPIWTEDADFFGAGVATWTSNRIALYLKSSSRTECQAPLAPLTALREGPGGYDF